MAGGFEAHLEDLFAPLGGVSMRKMFGGLGIFRRGVMFALVADDTLYFKVDDQTEADFEAEGCVSAQEARELREAFASYGADRRAGLDLFGRFPSLERAFRLEYTDDHAVSAMIATAIMSSMSENPCALVLDSIGLRFIVIFLQT